MAAGNVTFTGQVRPVVMPLVTAPLFAAPLFTVFLFAVFLGCCALVSPCSWVLHPLVATPLGHCDGYERGNGKDQFSNRCHTRVIPPMPC